MPINNIWVFAEAIDGKVKTLTLELLAKARTLGGASTTADLFGNLAFPCYTWSRG